MPRKYGQIRQPTARVKSTLDKKYSDANLSGKTRAWNTDKVGETHRYSDIFIWNLNHKPINHLFSLNNKKPAILFLGPGKGEYILPFKKNLKLRDLDPQIDLFGLFKETVSKDVKKEINTDFSCETPFESLDPKISEHKKLLQNMINKYDLIMGPMSVGVHTKYPSFALYQSALMLRKGGKAYVEVRSILSAQLDANFKVEKELPLLKKIFNRLINNYNKTYNQNNEYNLNILGDLETHTYNVFIEIERIR